MVMIYVEHLRRSLVVFVIRKKYVEQQKEYDMRVKLLLALVIGTILVIATYAMAARSITLPYEMKFNSGDDWTSALAWKGGGGCDTRCSITHQSTGGWSGGSAKIIPPQVACCDSINGCMCALGSFNGFSTARLNIRALYKFGPTYYSSFRNAGGGLYNKFIDVHNTSGVRSGIFYLIGEGSASAWFGLFNGGCAWWNNTPGCRLGSPLVSLTATQNNNQWISLEYELNSGGVTKAYMYKSDGTYATWTSQDTIPSGNMSQIEIGGFYNSIHAVDSGTWILIDELKISNTYIGPPEGFVGGGEGEVSAPVNLRVISP